MHYKFYGTILIFIVFLAGCVSVEQQQNNESDYNFTMAWADKVYGFTQEIVSPSEIESQVGITERLVSPFPRKNGDIGRRTPEGIMGIPVGSKLYKMKGEEDSLAVGIPNDHSVIYYKCVYISDLIR
ncbi:MAG: hypothetical protein IMW85_07755 [Thermicanus sp.]|nr:hypothetical protein [Thermicanus sp.]